MHTHPNMSSELPFLDQQFFYVNICIDTGNSFRLFFFYFLQTKVQDFAATHSEIFYRNFLPSNEKEKKKMLIFKKFRY